MIRSTIIKAVLSVSTLVLGTCGFAQAQTWPARPITMVVPFAAGGSTDITARMLAEKLGGILGQNIVVENRTGAGGNIGAAAVARATPDGYTILLHTSTLTANVSLYKNMGLNVQKDLIPVSQVALIPNVLMVNNDFQAKTLKDFVEVVKQKKVAINYGSSGSGASNHLAGVLFNNMVGGDMVHVPYKGGSLANNDLLAGQIQAVFSPLVEVLGFVDSGKLRPLGVTTKSRLAKFPNLPAIDEVLPGFEIVLWNGIFVPTGTPKDVVQKLSNAVQSVLQDPSVLAKLAEQGSTPIKSNPDDFKKVIDAEIVKWGDLIRMAGARVD